MQDNCIRIQPCNYSMAVAVNSSLWSNPSAVLQLHRTAPSSLVCFLPLSTELKKEETLPFGVGCFLPGRSPHCSGLCAPRAALTLVSPCTGIVIMMALCDEVDVYEFLPSKRQTDICHYYQKFHDRACTMGAYHPLLFEKNLVKHLNQGTNEDIYTHGKVTLPGFRNVHC